MIVEENSMRTRTPVILVVLLTLLLSLHSYASLRAAPSADAVVNAPCTEAAFDNALNTVQGSGSGTITFACGGPATITFSKQKTINEDVTIAGGNNVTLSGGGTTRIFNVAPNAVLTLRRITLSGGNGGNGGAILNRGTLVVEESTIRDSQATRGGGIYGQSRSDMTIVRSNITGNSADITGGGIEVKRATADISTSTFSENEAAFGGAVFNALGTTNLQRVTVNNNSAIAGAGVNNNRGTVNLVNVTISNNQANAGAGIGNSGVMTLSFVTLSGNTANIAGGIYHYGFIDSETFTMNNTILHAGAAGANCYSPATTATAITSAGFNLSSDNSCAAALTGAGDRSNLNPQLGSLNANGGPTRTHWLAPTSPALNQGQCQSGIAIDQRGVARPQGAVCDIGAVEVTQP
jgi:hypothetical protein